jgi:uncharacterized protein (TIGR02594 family)
LKNEVNEMNIEELRIAIIIAGSPTTDCPWMKIALGEQGVGEKSPKVAEYLKVVGLTGSWDWCSAFVNWCMNRAGNERTLAETRRKEVSAAGAKSWIVWGKPLSTPKFGAITIFNRPPNPGLGHVAFYVTEDAANIYVLGGNQQKSVNIAPYKKSNLLGYRWLADSN